MTQYSYKINFSDTEIIMLRAALKNMIHHCQDQLDKGKSAPYWAHQQSAQRVLNKLHDDVQQISGNNFDSSFNFGEEE